MYEMFDNKCIKYGHSGRMPVGINRMRWAGR